MGFEIMPLPESRKDEWWGVLANVFSFEVRPEDIAIADRRGYERAIAAVEGGAVVGTAATFGFEMTVPGGAAVPTGGLTAVTVLPTHRREGVLTSMTRELLGEMRERGEALSALWASESSIYGRFGYGAATESADLTIERAHTSLVPGPSPAGKVRFADAEAARSVIPGLYARATEGISGTLARRPGDWDLYFHDPEHLRDGSSELRFAVSLIGDDARGYVRYRVKSSWGDANPNHRLIVGDLQAVDGDAYRGLYEFVFGIDLVTAIELRTRRVREPVERLLVDPRRMQRRIQDALWVALVDPAAALAARSYAVEDELIVEVRDSFLSERGRFRISGGPDGSECFATDREPDLVVSAADLAAAYLGLSRFPMLAWLGRIDGSEEAVLRAHQMFGWHVEPWCTVHF